MSHHQDPAIIRARHERARRELVLATIRGALEEEPTPVAVRAAARRWKAAITALAADIADEHRHAAA